MGAPRGAIPNELERHYVRRAVVHSLVPLAVLEAVRNLDTPVEDGLSEFAEELLSKRLGLSPTVALQLAQYEAQVRRDAGADPAHVEALLRLVGRRPDADLVFADAGRRTAGCCSTSGPSTPSPAACSRWAGWAPDACSCSCPSGAPRLLSRIASSCSRCRASPARYVPTARGGSCTRTCGRSSPASGSRWRSRPPTPCPTSIACRTASCSCSSHSGPPSCRRHRSSRASPRGGPPPTSTATAA